MEKSSRRKGMSKLNKWGKGQTYGSLPRKVIFVGSQGTVWGQILDHLNVGSSWRGTPDLCESQSTNSSRITWPLVSSNMATENRWENHPFDDLPCEMPSLVEDFPALLSRDQSARWRIFKEHHHSVVQEGDIDVFTLRDAPCWVWAPSFWHLLWHIVICFAPNGPSMSQPCR